MLASDNRFDADYTKPLCMCVDISCFALLFTFDHFLKLFFFLSVCLHSNLLWIYLHLMKQTPNHQAMRRKKTETQNNARCYFFRLKRLMIFRALRTYWKEQKVFDPRVINSLAESQISLLLLSENHSFVVAIAANFQTNQKRIIAWMFHFIENTTKINKRIKLFCYEYSLTDFHLTFYR